MTQETQNVLCILNKACMTRKINWSSHYAAQGYLLSNDPQVKAHTFKMYMRAPENAIYSPIRKEARNA